MANVTTKFSRLTSQSVNAGAPETRLLSPGALNTDFKGALNFAANTLVAGDVVRLFLGFTWTNNTGNFGNLQARVYLGTSVAPAAPTGLIADTGTLSLQNNNPGTQEFTILVEFTIRTTGNPGTGWCDAFLIGLFPNRDSGYPWPCGKLSFNLDTTAANSLEVTGTVGANGSMALTQASVEYLPTP
jgi:hypothetical protein